MTRPAPDLLILSAGIVSRLALAGCRNHTRHQHIGDFLPGR